LRGLKSGEKWVWWSALEFLVMKLMPQVFVAQIILPGFEWAEFIPTAIPEIEELLGEEQTVIINGNYLTEQGLILGSIEEVSATNFRNGNTLQLVLETFVDHFSAFNQKTAENVKMAAQKALQYLNITEDDNPSPIRRFRHLESRIQSLNPVIAYKC
jgi:hypothetical protein